MPYKLILRYSATAIVAAAIIAAIALALRLIHSRRPLNRRDALFIGSVAYLAAVLQIIGLRLGLVVPKLLGGEIRYTPLKTTIEQWQKGAGLFIYHTIGNMIWFVPSGVLLPCLFPRCRLWHVAVFGALLSAIVEVLQYLLGTGLTDIDDILFNTLGAVAGYLLFSAIRKTVKKW